MLHFRQNITNNLNFKQFLDNFGPNLQPLFTLKYIYVYDEPVYLTSNFITVHLKKSTNIFNQSLNIIQNLYT